MTLNYNFAGKTVLVTGGSSGIGLKLVETLAECGAKVISLSIDTNELDTLIQEKPIYTIESINCDISDWAELERVANSLPVVDCLVNNAAILGFAKFGEISSTDVDALFDTNVKAIINLSQVVSNVWKLRKIKGVIVNVSTQGSKVSRDSIAVYCATKAAVDSLTRSMALELGPYGIRVNSVNPTLILTKHIRSFPHYDELYKACSSRISLGRPGEVFEVVDVIMYLLTDRCTLVTGANILVDGGFTIC